MQQQQNILLKLLMATDCNSGIFYTVISMAGKVRLSVSCRILVRLLRRSDQSNPRNKKQETEPSENEERFYITCATSSVGEKDSSINKAPNTTKCEDRAEKFFNVHNLLGFSSPMERIMGIEKMKNHFFGIPAIQ